MAHREAADFVQRLAAVEARLRALAATPLERTTGTLTAADPGTGERWEWGQVWAHLAEFVPYWIAQADAVIDGYRGDPVGFGRTKADAGRIAAIERDRHAMVAALWSRLESQLSDLRSFLTELPDRAWEARGAHPTLGVMSLPKLVDEFLVGHLEQHADQLDSLVVG